MVDLRIIYKEQLDYCTAIANDIIKHNGSREICEYAAKFCSLDSQYDEESNYGGEWIRVNFGECYCYVDVDDNDKPTGEISYENDEMVYFEFNDYSYEGTVEYLNSISKKKLYENAEYAWCYDEYEGKEKGYIKYIPMEV